MHPIPTLSLRAKWTHDDENVWIAALSDAHWKSDLYFPLSSLANSPEWKLVVILPPRLRSGRENNLCDAHLIISLIDAQSACIIISFLVFSQLFLFSV